MMNHKRAISFLVCEAKAGIKRQRGLTLMEVVVSTFLVGSVLVTSLQSSASWRRVQHQNQQYDFTRRLADELASEIMSTAFFEPSMSAPNAFGRESGENATDRSAWDDVDDYHNLAETTIRDKRNTTLTDVFGYRRTVVVAPAIASAAAPGYQSNSILTSPLRLVVVTATSPDGKTTSIARTLKCNVQTELPSALEHHRSAIVELDDSGSRTTRSISTLNLPEVLQ